MLNVLAAVAIFATFDALCSHSAKVDLDFENKLTIEPLPPWNPKGRNITKSMTELSQFRRRQTSIALLTTQFTNYMFDHSVVVNRLRCNYDIRLDSYELEYAWKLSVNSESGTDKIALVRMSGDSKYAINPKTIVIAESTIASEIAREFTATLLSE